jgi:hypothetical protein
MTKQEKVAQSIKRVVSTMMDRVMDNVMGKDPFIMENYRYSKPPYTELLPDEIFKVSHFERRFVTPFGGAWEKLAMVVANQAHGQCEVGYF